MAGILYAKQRKENQGLILDPDEFQVMLANAEPSLANFFDQLYIGTNPHDKSRMTNTRNRRRLVLFCYFLAGLNNKFINGVKAEIGYLLDSAGVSSTALETIAGAGISIRRETVARYKRKREANHINTVGTFMSEYVSIKFLSEILYMFSYSY
jgi:hypothetical protein